MNLATLTTFFALLSLACAAGTVVTLVVWVVSRVAPGPTIDSVRSSIGDAGLWLGWVVAATTTAGSLYYSIGAGYEPCELCWYQRICVYPLSAVLLVAAVRRDRAVWKYTLPLCVIGVVIAGYHTQLQAFPDQTTFCNLNNPCTVRYVWEFGFVSLPFMALTAFCFIIAVMSIAASTPPTTGAAETAAHETTHEDDR